MPCPAPGQIAVQLHPGLHHLKQQPKKSGPPSQISFLPVPSLWAHLHFRNGAVSLGLDAVSKPTGCILDSQLIHDSNSSASIPTISLSLHDNTKLCLFFLLSCLVRSFLNVWIFLIFCCRLCNTFKDTSRKLIELYIFIKQSWSLCQWILWFSLRPYVIACLEIFFPSDSALPIWLGRSMIIGSNPVVTLCLLSGEMQFSLLMSLTCSLHLLLAHSDIWLLTSSQSVQQFAHHMYQVILTGTTIAKLLRDVM